MQITRYTDYALRLLMYLASHKTERVTIAEVAGRHQISKNHLMKVTQLLSNQGYITAVRGKNGGLFLGQPAEHINIGELVRLTEQHTALVDCFGGGQGCTLTPACYLKNMFAEALETFFSTLDQYSVADLVTPQNRPMLVRLFQSESHPPKNTAALPDTIT